MNSVLAFNGPRSLIQPWVGSIMFGESECRAYAPGIPIGSLCFPIIDFYQSVGGWEKEKTADMVKDDLRALRENGVSASHLQVIIVEDGGAIQTISSAVAVAILQSVSAEASQKFGEIATKIGEAAGVLEGGYLNGLSGFESLSRLHCCAGFPRGRSPGHWLRWRGNSLANRRKGKGAWKTRGGEWMADHHLALDYAMWLFPKFEIWAFDLIMDDPAAESHMDVWFSELFTTVPVVVDPETKQATPHLVIDNGPTSPEVRP